MYYRLGMAFDRKTLVIPDQTKFEEKTIIAKGDVIIGDRCLIQFGVKTEGRIFVGEHVIIDGNLEATKDIRADIFSSIGGNVKSGGNVYLGEKVKVKGKLSLKGDLDVGDSVEITNGFEAQGWINIRSPIPMIIYVFIYLVQLLKMGHSEEIDRILEELEENNGETIPISEIFLFIPNNSIIGLQKSRVDSDVRIGKKSVIIGNYDIKGDVIITDDCIINGTIKSTGNTFFGKNVDVQGNIEAVGEIKIDEKSKIVGNISGGKIYLSKKASVQGMLFAKDGVSFTDPSVLEAEEKVNRFESNLGIVDEVNNILE
ncbi:MAG: polymer-forming cytoskeletal protein [Candidatus Thermoplasmatota archaeon]|nr:polymer-forming cytoskeletal protein [Candidatus Thermoplasmatota archaeon]